MKLSLSLIFILSTFSFNGLACRRSSNLHSTAHIKAILNDLSKIKKYKNHQIKSISHKDDNSFLVLLRSKTGSTTNISYALESQSNCSIKIKNRTAEVSIQK